MTRSLNLDQLATLTAVAELGSFSAAARRLNLSQPAISLQIRELETRFGVRLLERMGKTAYPTEPGRALIAHAAQIAAACEETTAAMRRFRDGWLGRVHIGTTLTALMYSLPALLRRLRADHPGLELVVTNMATRDSVDGVLQNRLDLALVTLPVDEKNLIATPLRDEKLVALLPADTPNPPDVVTPAYAASMPLVTEHQRGAVYRLVNAWIAPYLPLPIKPMEIGTIEAAKRGVAGGLGISFVPDVAAEPMADVIVRPIAPEVPCTLGLIQHRNKPDSPALAIVRQALLSIQTAGARRLAARKRHPAAPEPLDMDEAPASVSDGANHGPAAGGALSS
ncbi:MAG: LysR family transcriptional regulator [Alphaproteobacteria bacterium]|nr:LysR family transcriptional regulator [Alphaproteobacteria bacterium]